MLTGNQVRLIRLMRGLKQHELADLAGLSFSLISSIERGVRKVTPLTDNRIQNALNLNDGKLQVLREIEAGMSV